MVSRRLDNTQQVTAADSGYPSPRYFQIHFQHLQQLIESLKEQMQETNGQLAELKQRQQDALAKHPAASVFLVDPLDP